MLRTLMALTVSRRCYRSCVEGLHTVSFLYSFTIPKKTDNGLNFGPASKFKEDDVSKERYNNKIVSTPINTELLGQQD